MGWFKSLFVRCRSATGETQYSDCRESFQSSREECREVIEREFGFHDSAELAHHRLNPASVSRSKEAAETMTKISVRHEKDTAVNARVGKRVPREAISTKSLGSSNKFLTIEQSKMADEISDSLKRIQQDIADINLGLASIALEH